MGVLGVLFTLLSQAFGIVTNGSAYMNSPH